MTNYPFNYPGNKVSALPTIGAYLRNSEVLYELFTGSGVVSYNVPAKHKVACEIDQNVFSMHKAIQTFDYTKYEKLVTFIHRRWRLNRPDDYFAFRDWFNKTLWQTQHKQAGLGLLVLAGSCINGMLRFGPNGFNQGSGERSVIHSAYAYTRLHAAARQIQFVNDDYRNLKIPKTANVFADPPYLENRVGTYDKCWSADDLRQLLKTLSKHTFVCTDTENRVNRSFCKHFGLKQTVLKAMRKNSPGGKVGQLLTGRNEIVFTNARLPSIFQDS